MPVYVPIKNVKSYGAFQGLRFMSPNK